LLAEDAGAIHKLGGRAVAEQQRGNLRFEFGEEGEFLAPGTFALGSEPFGNCCLRANSETQEFHKLGAGGDLWQVLADDREGDPGWVRAVTQRRREEHALGLVELNVAPNGPAAVRALAIFEGCKDLGWRATEERVVMDGYGEHAGSSAGALTKVAQSLRRWLGGSLGSPLENRLKDGVKAEATVGVALDGSALASDCACSRHTYQWESHISKRKGEPEGGTA
jgi:hypothetical protein